MEVQGAVAVVACFIAFNHLQRGLELEHIVSNSQFEVECTLVIYSYRVFRKHGCQNLKGHISVLMCIFANKGMTNKNVRGVKRR